MNTHCYGTVLGRFLECGGIAQNLEFIFKHGYGRPDISNLTPTEELPGSEIYDTNGEHAKWLEELLYYGEGTRNHLQALRFWRENKGRKFYVDFTNRDLFLRLKSLNLAITEPTENPIDGKEYKEVIKIFDDKDVAHVSQIIQDHIQDNQPLVLRHSVESNLILKKLRSWNATGSSSLPYFSMGGIGHNKFCNQSTGSLCNWRGDARLWGEPSGGITLGVVPCLCTEY